MLIENLPDAFACHQILRDSDGTPVDYIFLDVNTAFTEMTGLTRDGVIGKKVTEVLPGITESSFDWIGTYGQVALTGESVRFENFFEPLNRRYEVTAYSDESGFFSVVFRDVSSHKVQLAPRHDIFERRDAEQEITELHQTLLDILDSIEATIYVADIETDKILFINRYGERIFGSSAGKKCRQMLQQGQSDPCDLCATDHQLLDAAGRPTGVYQREFKNPKNGRWYDCRDTTLRWINERMIRLGMATDITRYKQMQEELQKERDVLTTLLKEMLDTATIWIDILDLEANVIFWNKAAEEISGYAAEEVTGHARVWEWLFPDLEYRASLAEFFKVIFHQDTQIENFETNICRKDGQYRTILWHVNHLVEQGKTTGIIALADDITERKQAENALHESNKKLSYILNSYRDAMFIHDLKGRIFEINDATCEHLGYSHEEILKKSLSDFVHPEHCMLITERMDKILASGCSVFESADINRDGKVIPVEVSATVIEYEGKTAVLSVVRDISERKKAEEALNKMYNDLQASEENYRLLANNTPDLIYSLDRESRHTAVNESVCRTFGLEARVIIGKTHRELGIPENLTQEWEKLHQKVFNTGKVVETEFTIPMYDGTVRTYEAILMPVFDEKGKVTSISGTSRDISFRKKMEEEILKSNKLESISILAGGIAHDFNNYLATLLGNVSLAKRYQNDVQKILEKLEDIESATYRAKNLANQLFAFAKGTAPVKKKVYLNRLIEDNVKFTLSGSNVRGSLFIDENLDPVEIDEGQISQVLNNIIINAIQAMPEGGVIEVSSENIDLAEKRKDYSVPVPEGPYVKISIKDEGQGIPENNLNKIFDPFFTTKQNGSGLGLAISDSIIKNHGGYLSVDSKIGVGTNFLIFLPASTHDSMVVTEKESIYFGTGKILVMDDNEEFRKVTGEMLMCLGYDVFLARDGREAIEIYMDAFKSGQQFNLVIMDLTVPGSMGGKNTIRELLKKDPEAKAVVSSGYPDDPVIAGFSKYGFKGVIKKPFSIEELSGLVHEILQC